MTDLARWTVPAFMPPRKPDDYTHDMGLFTCPIANPQNVRIDNDVPPSDRLWRGENTNAWWCETCAVVHTQPEWEAANRRARENNDG